MTEIYRAADWNMMRPGPGGSLDDDAAILSSIALAGDLIAWGRGNAVWPMTFGLACCAIEMMAVGASRFDLDRFGIELADGARHAARVPDALGDPENPLDAAGIRAKALALMNAGGLDAGRAGKLADACLALATGGKVSDVAQALP